MTDLVLVTQTFIPKGRSPWQLWLLGFWFLLMSIHSYNSQKHTEEHIEITRFHKYVYLPQLYKSSSTTFCLWGSITLARMTPFFTESPKCPCPRRGGCSLLLMFSLSCQWHLCPLNDQLASPKTYLLFSLTTPGTTFVGFDFLKSSQDRIR